MLNFGEAQQRVLAMAPRMGAERVGLEEAAGRVLAEDVLCPVDVPAFDGSVMDGYAVRAADFAGDGPWEFPVRGESRAGEPLDALTPNTVARIFTGAPLPAQADAVVMQEHVERDGDRARFTRTVNSGHFVRKRGDDLRAGSVAIAKGTRLRPAHVALAATVDRAWLTVTRRPRVVLLATGDELRSPGTPGPVGSIAESNTLGLAAMARRAGATVAVAPLVPDDLNATMQAFEAALADADVVISVGGVSVGDHDRVRPALEAIGVQLDFYKVAMKPGKPLALGKRGSTVVLGLPGNPVSAMVTFAFFGVPLLRAMQGDGDPLPRSWRARTGRAITREPGRLEFARASLVREGASWIVTSLENQASGAVAMLARANALMVVPAERTELAEGEDVEVYLLEELGA
ncbi:molybdopterin molybdotransferase MoeA [Pendulispora rubella]|uniref:Molybdopterin molybdenumtransferase n=1 Tax=Pendulispora rubella TaxID=2741070 RepID=A0ABZ2LF96_9BACT